MSFTDLTDEMVHQTVELWVGAKMTEINAFGEYLEIEPPFLPLTQRCHFFLGLVDFAVASRFACCGVHDDLRCQMFLQLEHVPLLRS